MLAAGCVAGGAWLAGRSARARDRDLSQKIGELTSTQNATRATGLW